MDLTHLQWNEWFNLFLRWGHLIAGISWTGSSFYFMWLDSSLEPEIKNPESVEGSLWMVHSGGFYQVQKRKIRPGEVPKNLHWFKWEAFLTWLTGIILLASIYYLSGTALLVDAGQDFSKALLFSIGMLIVGWFGYDFLFSSKLAQQRLSSAVGFIFFVGFSYLAHLFMSGRAMFIHMGALMGTIMVANVWVRILPAQSKMIQATEKGEIPDYTLGLRAKRRSVHNSYLIFPVLFIMLSNHYSLLYSGNENWLKLSLLFLMGVGIRHAMLKQVAWSLIPSAAAFVGLVFLCRPPSESYLSAATPVHFDQIKAVVETKCRVCHSAHPTDATFGAMPGGINFDDISNVERFRDRIKVRVVDTQTMPPGNKTGVTAEERALIGQWVNQDHQ